MALSSCATMPQIQQALDDSDAYWESENKKLIKTLGIKYFKISKTVAFNALTMTFSELGMTIENANKDTGIMYATAQAPTPLTPTEWSQVKKIEQQSDALMNSETPGSVLDRLSINALKIYHMHEESTRVDAREEHRQDCRLKLEILQEQRQDLGRCLEALMEDLICGKKYLKVYRELKMYNDPTLNPVLYQKKK